MGEVKQAPSEPAATSTSTDAATTAPGAAPAAGDAKDGADVKKDEGDPFASTCDPCMNYYLCHFMGHQFHFTEVFCLLAFGGCIVAGVYVMSDGKLPTQYFSIILSVYSAFAFVFVWGYARISSLAELANQLGHVAKKTSVEARKYELINKTLSQQANVYDSQLNILHNTGDELMGSAKQIEALMPALEALQNKQEDMCRIQIELGDREEQFAQESKLAAEDKDKELLKNGMRIVFEQYTQTNTLSTGTIKNTKEHRDAIMAYWRHKNLPPSKALENVLDESKRSIIMVHTVVQIMDDVLDTRFHRLKNVKNETTIKIGKVQEQKAKMEKKIAKYASDLANVGKDTVDLDDVDVL